MTTVLPIVDRELRVTARRAWTYWMRAAAALVMLGTCFFVLKESRPSATAMLGQDVLNAMGVIVLSLCMVSGIFLTSDCLSEEKREGTIGLLFLTDLKAYDVVLGKLAANSLQAFFGLLAVFPVLALPLMLGGVTGWEFVRLIFVFVVTLFFSLSVGLAVSALAMEAKQAVMGTFLLLALFSGLFPLVWWLQELYVGSGAMGRWSFLLWPSPGYAYVRAFDGLYRTKIGGPEFWSAISVQAGIGLAGIISAMVVLPRSWHGAAVASKRKQGRSFTGLLIWTPKVKFRDCHWLAPMEWLASRDRSCVVIAKRTLSVLIPCWILMLVASPLVDPQNTRQGVFMATVLSAYGLHLLVKVLIATEASRRMNEDRRSGAWELLLVTPLKVKDILAGQERALRRLFVGPMVTMFLINAAMVVVVIGFSKRMEMRRDDRFLFCEMFSGGMLCMLADFYGLAWLGMWRGLTSKQHHRAIGGTLAQIMTLPVLLVFFTIILQPTMNENQFKARMAMWFLIGVTISLASGAWARRKLQQNFRAAVLGAPATGKAKSPGGLK